MCCNVACLSHLICVSAITSVTQEPGKQVLFKRVRKESRFFLSEETERQETTMAEGKKACRIFSLHKEQRIRFHLLLQELEKVVQTSAVRESRFFI